MCWWVKLTGTLVDLLLSAYRHLDYARKNIQLELKTMYMYLYYLSEWNSRNRAFWHQAKTS